MYQKYCSEKSNKTVIKISNLRVNIIIMVIASNINRIDYPLFPLKSSEKHGFSDAFGANRS